MSIEAIFIKKKNIDYQFFFFKSILKETGEKKNKKREKEEKKMIDKITDYPQKIICATVIGVKRYGSE